MIELNRKVKVHSFDVEGTIAVGRDRPEFLAVARLAADLRQRLDGRTVARELLGLPEQVGWRVIDRCVALGLLDRPGSSGPAGLTENGRIALERGEVLVPEEGVWRLYHVQDPLIDAPLLHCARLEPPNAKEERDALHKARQDGQRRPAPGATPPSTVSETGDSGQLWISVCSGQAFEVRELAGRGEHGPTAELALHLRWSEDDGPRLMLHGRLPNTRQGTSDLRVDHNVGTPRALQGVTYDQVWMALVEAATDVPGATLQALRERTGQRLLPVTFASIPGSARRTFSQNVDVPGVETEQFGTFEPTRLSDVALVPTSNDDAQAWAEWLQWDGLSGYAVPAQLETAAHIIAKRFPFHRVRPLDSAALLARALREPSEPRARFLFAPSDLGLWS